VEPLLRGGGWHGLTLAAMGRTEGRKSRWRTLALWIIAADAGDLAWAEQKIKFSNIKLLENLGRIDNTVCTFLR
jgi:hypothetical protein